MKIALKFNDRFVTAEINGDVTCSRPALGSWEKWTVQPLDGGLVALRSDHGAYLKAELGGGEVVHPFFPRGGDGAGSGVEVHEFVPRLRVQDIEEP